VAGKSALIGWHQALAATVLAATVLFFVSLFAGLIAYAAGYSWIDVVRSSEFRFAALFTVGTTLASTTAVVFSGLACAYAMARLEFPGKALVDTILDFPLVLPPLVSGVALLIFFGPIMGARLASIGIRVVFTPLGVVVAQWFVTLPFALKVFREAFESIDARYENIARTLGCSPFKVFALVSLPLARRGIGSGIALTWARTVGEFGATAMLAGVTRMKTETMAAAVFLNMSIGELGFTIVLSVILLAAAMAILFVFRMLSSREHSRGFPREARRARERLS
jgi:molybdate transport system permease protein